MPRHRPVPTRETNRRKKAATPPQSPAAAERVPRRSTGATASRAAYRRAPLAGLRVFVAVAEHKSFTRGGGVLGGTASGARTAVQALGEHLRVPLLRRHGPPVW